MFLRRPYYFRDFRCIASACTDSCCAGWEIDIDPDTLAYYQTVKGAFGERLRENICIPDADDTEEAELPHFIQTADERCPFLNDCNLCDIFITLGEDHLSRICTYHPRFFDWFLTGQEAGLGLCCEEAARLTLLPHTGDWFETVETEEEPETDDEDPESRALTEALEKLLFERRAKLFDRIDRSEQENEPLSALIDALAGQTGVCQKQTDAFFFGEEEETENRETGSFTADFFDPEKLRARLAFYETLEINDAAWWEQLERLKENLPALLSAREAFEATYRERMYEYRNLLRYFLFRHFMAARMDGMAAGRIGFALQSVLMIELLDIDMRLAGGELTIRDQIDLCKLYSKEIEYDEDNTAALIEREDSAFLGKSSENIAVRF